MLLWTLVVSLLWQDARPIVRLKPSAFEDISAEVRVDLERRGCRVPQTYLSDKPHNIAKGRFISARQIDTAVLCSRNRVSEILIYRGGNVHTVDRLESSSDEQWFQTIDGQGTFGYSRNIVAASTALILERLEAHIDEEKLGLHPVDPSSMPRIAHDGLIHAFAEKGSSIWYWNGRKWMELPGSD